MIRNAAAFGAVLSRSPNRISGAGACQSARKTAPSGAGARALALSHKGLTGVGLRPSERGRPARNAALTRADTLILAFSHKGRRDPLTAICT